MSDPYEDLTPEEEAIVNGDAEDTSAKPEPAAAEPGQEAARSGTQAEPSGDAGTNGSEPPKEESPKQDMVPHAALNAERQRVREMRAEMDAMKAQLEKLTAANPEPEPEPMPDAVMEPERFAEWMTKRQAEAGKPAEALAQEFEAFRAQQAAQSRHQRMLSETQRHEMAFVAQNPDYYDAFDHLRQARIAEMKAIAPGATDEQIAQAISNDTMAILNNAAQAGTNPAETFYALAKIRGYAPKASEPAPQETSRVEAAKKAAAAAASLGAAPGGDVRNLTLADINAMSEAELAKLSDDDFARAGQSA